MAIERLGFLKRFYKRLLESSGWLLFLAYLLFAVFLSLADTTFVNTDVAFAKYLQEKADAKYSDNDEYIEDFEEDLSESGEEVSTFHVEDILWDSFFILLEVGLTVPFIAAMVLLGFVLSGEDSGSEFQQITKITMVSYFIFLLPDIISIFWFLYVQPTFLFQDLINFTPLSILNFLPHQDMPGWLLTLLRPVNLFEIVFILSLAFGLHLSFGHSYGKMLGRVTLCYGGSLYAWKICLLYFSYLL